MEAHVHWKEFEKFPIKKAKDSLALIYSFQAIYFMHKAIKTYKRHQIQTHKTHAEI